MKIQSFPSGPFETNAYVISDPKSLECAIIDPAPDSGDSVIQYIEANRLIPKMILLTHSHWDHIVDTAFLKKRFHVPVMIHELDAPNLEVPGSDGLPCWVTIEGVKPDKFLNEGDLLSFGNCHFEVIHTPGHTPGGVCFFSKDPLVLISGDTLFKGSIGNLSFPTARPNLMWRSLDKLAKLPAETEVFPGHGPSTTIGKESSLLKRMSSNS